MPGFFDDDSDEEEAPRVIRPAPAANPARRAPYARQPSVSATSDSSRAESSRRPNGPAGARGRGRYESTASPRTDRVSDSAPMDTEDDMSSIGGYRGGRRGMDMDMDMNMFGDGADGDGDGDGEGPEGDEELEGDMDDVRRLGLVWVRERGTSHIMRWEGDLIDSVFDKLEQQQKMVDTLRSDPDTNEEEHFKLVLVMTEMERVKYLVRSYVRTRLWKIEKYSQYITLTPDVQLLLSGAEIQHAKNYTELLHTHFQHSVLDSLPEWLRKMDDTYGDGLSMIPKPNKNVPVLIYCRRDCGEITLPDGEPAPLGKGTTHLVKYHLVEQWVKLGWAEVL